MTEKETGDLKEKMACLKLLFEADFRNKEDHWYQCVDILIILAKDMGIDCGWMTQTAEEKVEQALKRGEFAEVVGGFIEMLRLHGCASDEQAVKAVQVWVNRKYRMTKNYLYDYRRSLTGWSDNFKREHAIISAQCLIALMREEKREFPTDISSTATAAYTKFLKAGYPSENG